MKLFPEIWCLTMWGHLKFVYEALNWTASDQITLSWTMYCQTKACITKLSCEICAPLWYYSIEWQFITGVSGQHIGPFFKSQEVQKRQHSMIEINWHNLLFSVLSIIQFFKEAWRSEFSCVSIFRQRSHNMGDPLDWAILNHWTPQKQKIKMCTWEQI